MQRRGPRLRKQRHRWRAVAGRLCLVSTIVRASTASVCALTGAHRMHNGPRTKRQLRAKRCTPFFTPPFLHSLNTHRLSSESCSHKYPCCS